mmetsp:Transcript_27322/g.51796  ORF Transcript_27322/g.51796 Transcript_27322/m.51796 type:complete len:227 (-) Transcript_27322:175-855(-)
MSKLLLHHLSLGDEIVRLLPHLAVAEARAGRRRGEPNAAAKRHGRMAGGGRGRNCQGRRRLWSVRPRGSRMGPGRLVRCLVVVVGFASFVADSARPSRGQLGLALPSLLPRRRISWPRPLRAVSYHIYIISPAVRGLLRGPVLRELVADWRYGGRVRHRVGPLLCHLYMRAGEVTNLALFIRPAAPVRIVGVNDHVEQLLARRQGQRVIRRFCVGGYCDCPISFIC